MRRRPGLKKNITRQNLIRKSVRSMERITIGLDLGEKSSRYCAIESVFPHAQVQLCIVHLTRASLNYVSWKERKQSPRI